MSHSRLDPAAVSTALRKTTEVLAAELAHPSTLLPFWSPFEWRVARAAAALHGVSPLLATTLRWRGPSGWNNFLMEQRSHTLARHARIQALIGQIHYAARAADVALVALEGAALHAIGLYAAGERPMADLDLLVAPRQTPAAIGLLRSLGFEELSANWKHRVFAPADRAIRSALGEHAGNYLKIELHERIVELLPQRGYDVTARVLPAHMESGINRYPSNAALLTHLLIHAAGAMAYRALRLMYVQDLARVARRLSPVEWEEVLAPTSTAQLWWSLPPLQLTSRYFALAQPL